MTRPLSLRQLHSFPTRRSSDLAPTAEAFADEVLGLGALAGQVVGAVPGADPVRVREGIERSEEHTSELQSRGHLVCRLLLQKKNRHDSIYLTEEFRIWIRLNWT